MGKSVRYLPEFAEIVKNLLAEGKSQKRCCEILGVGSQTFDNWKRLDPIFADVVQEHCVSRSQKVGEAVYRRAMGYEYDEVTEIVEVDDGIEKRTVRTVRKIVLPDVSAQKFFLVNRDKDNWSSGDLGLGLKEGPAPSLSLNYNVKEPIKTIDITHGSGDVVK